MKPLPKEHPKQRKYTSHYLILSKFSAVVGHGNNDELIIQFFIKNNWTVLRQSSIKFTRFHFKWVTSFQDIDYSLMVEGAQIVNHIQNISIFTTKAGLLQTLSVYDLNRKEAPSTTSTIRMADFYPTSYALDVSQLEISPQEKQFLQEESKGIWISKPSTLNCARGIQMIDDIKDFKLSFLQTKLNF